MTGSVAEKGADIIGEIEIEAGPVLMQFTYRTTVTRF